MKKKKKKKLVKKDIMINNLNYTKYINCKHLIKPSKYWYKRYQKDYSLT